MQQELHELSVTEQAALLEAKQLSSVELTEHYLARIEALDGTLNALITVDAAGAREQAQAADDLRQHGAATPLTGIPLIHKDIFCTRGLLTTCGSRMLESFVAPYDATVVSKLRAVGMVTLGKANMDEFAMGSSNENSYFGPVSNPWDTSRVPGGSSGGSAAAVAAGLAPLATATDTGGSIRQPAALCGITGIKPTYGRVSRYGMVAFASSLDQGGAMGTSAEDCALCLAAMAGHDPRDATSLDLAVPDYRAALDGGVRGLRIGVPEEYFTNALDNEVATAVQAALAEFEALGATLVSVHLPRQSMGIPAYYVVAPAEASSNLSRFDGVRFGHRAEGVDGIGDLYRKSRDEGFGAEVKRRILIGTYVLSAGYYDAYYTQARKVRRLISDDFDRVFTDVDVIAGPTTPDVAFGKGEEVDDPVAMYLNDLYTVAANLAGIPALSMPCGMKSGLPIGLQLIGRSRDESTLFRLAHAYQQATDWHRQRAPLFSAADGEGR